MAGWRFELAACIKRMFGRDLVLTITTACILGVGLTGSIFGLTLLDALLFQSPAGVDHPQLVERLYVRDEGDGIAHVSNRFTAEEFERLRRAGGAAASLAAYSTRVGSFDDGRTHRSLRVAVVSPHFFSVIGATAHVGKLLDSSTDRSPGGRGVVLSYDLAKSLESSNAVAGHSVYIDGELRAVAGVASPGFVGIDRVPVHAWVLASDAEIAGTPESAPPKLFQVIARRRDNGAAAALEAPLTRVLTEANDYQGATSGAKRSVIVGRLNESRGPLRSPVTFLVQLLTAVSVIVVAVTCANVVTLLLVRTAGRAVELAIRGALGASPQRLALMLAVECLLIGLCGSCVGAVGGRAAVSVFRLVSSDFLPKAAWTWRLVVADGLAGLLVAVAMFVAIVGQTRGLRSVPTSNRSATLTHARKRSHSILLTCQVSLTLLLIAAAVLFSRSYASAQRDGLRGGGPETYVVDVNAPRGTYSSDRVVDVLELLTRELAATPGIRAVALSSAMPTLESTAFQVRLGGATIEPLRTGGPYVEAVSPTYFNVRGMRAIEGTSFDAARPAANQVVVNSTLARTIAPAGSAVGRCLQLSKEASCRTVVGVVDDIRRESAIESPTMMMYVPYAGRPSALAARSLFVRLSRDATPLVRATYATLASAGIARGDIHVSSLRDLAQPEVRIWAMGSVLVGALAFIAVVVAFAGLVATESYWLAQTRAEWGVRLALGATSSHVALRVARRALRDCGAGVIIGLAEIILCGRAMENRVFISIRLNDPVAIAVIAAGIVATVVVVGLAMSTAVTKTSITRLIHTE